MMFSLLHAFFVVIECRTSETNSSHPLTFEDFMAV